MLTALILLTAYRLGARNARPVGGLGAVWGHRGVPVTVTAGVAHFRDPCTGDRRAIGFAAGGLKAAHAEIDAALARGCGVLGMPGAADDDDTLIERRLSFRRPQNAKEVAHGWQSTGYISTRLRMLADRGVILRVPGRPGFYLRRAV